MIGTIKGNKKGMGDLESVLRKMGFNYRGQSRKASMRSCHFNKDLKYIREIVM